jgi:hypothetical protein
MDLGKCKCYYFNWQGQEVTNPKQCEMCIYLEESQEAAEKYIRMARRDAIPGIKRSIKELTKCWDGEQHQNWRQ